MNYIYCIIGLCAASLKTLFLEFSDRVKEKSGCKIKEDRFLVSVNESKAQISCAKITQLIFALFLQKSGFLMMLLMFM